jgi:hypothetical protein
MDTRTILIVGVSFGVAALWVITRSVERLLTEAGLMRAALNEIRSLLEQRR